MDVSTENGQADVRFEAASEATWEPTSIFPSFEAASEFFRRGDCGFSCSLREGQMEGLRMKTLRWEMSALRIQNPYAAFFQDEKRFPPDSIHFDCGLLMRGIPHEWHEISQARELAAVARD